jgi:hypothetical protein
MPDRLVQHGDVDVSGSHRGDRDARPLSKFGDISVTRTPQPVRIIKPLSVPRARRYRYDSLGGNDKCDTAANTAPRVNEPLCAFGGVGTDRNPDATAIKGDDATKKLAT